MVTAFFIAQSKPQKETRAVTHQPFEDPDATPEAVPHQRALRTITHTHTTPARRCIC